MTTPNRNQINEKAIELYFKHERNGCINPETNELRESGFTHDAKIELMQNTERNEALSYVEQCAYELGYRLIPKGKFEQQNYVDLKTLHEEILIFGDLIIISHKGTGKTNTMMQFVRDLRKNPFTKVVIFETFPKWIHEFDTIPYLYIQDSDVIRTDDKKFRSVRHNEIKAVLNANKDLLFCLEIEDVDRLSYFMASIIKHFYRKRYLTAYKYGLSAIKENIVFVAEEAHNLFDSTVLTKTVFNRLRKMYSEARNFKMHFLMCSQRIQDLSTKIRGRSRFLIGRVNVDDYDLKIGRLLRNSRYKNQVLNLEIGKFVYPSKDALIQFELFEQCGKPYECVNEKTRLVETVIVR